MSHEHQESHTSLGGTHWRGKGKRLSFHMGDYSTSRARRLAQTGQRTTTEPDCLHRGSIEQQSKDYPHWRGKGKRLSFHRSAFTL